MIETNKFRLTFGTLLLAAVLVMAVGSRAVPIVLQTNLENLPLDIAGFQGAEDNFPPSVYEELNADRHVYRHYRSPDRKQVDLYIGYYGTAKGGRSTHNPYACLPGAGWAILETGQEKVLTEYFPQGITVNYILTSKEESARTIFHWYQSAGDRVLSTGFQQNIERFLGRILRNRNDGAYVQVSVPSGQDGVEEAKALAKSFVGEILELLPKYWPDEG